MRLLKLVPENTNIQFLKYRKVAMAISILMIVASIALVAVRGLNLGVDFVGGQSVRVEFTQEMPPIDEIREKVGDIGLGEATIQQFGTDTAVSIRTALPDGDKAAADRAGRQLVDGIKKAFPTATTGSVETVSGKVSNELLRTGALSLLLAMIAISIYIWIRFEWQFGVGALFALFHDVALTFGFFALTQMQFDLNIVAALLTIIGYSLNDTIVVFDRIRENLKKYRKMEIIPLLDLSINETLARTVMTSFTMLIALAVLLWVGPDVIFGFTAAMLLGIFVGTYSSVYMSAPILVWLKVGPDSFIPRTSAATAGAERIDRNDDGAVV
ncbi:protein translocase subunit SecF [Sphingopyxis sp. XHP0097]|jgi:preprotein translocase subunit SecF|uniref:Protein-export membrane protein SecF n=1 Tax=Sphingopyxis jiangsuensis TaxID=2871171 RepID=A0ABS7MCL5_9SPHN|nr:MULTISPECIES: protein translocase subunit SecF [Sphingopyxis]MBL0767861.1 protein translocase subunit SecF [Sphingopyxis lutea]MBY4636409.1 protein translocase subunit SecF [Sphingopyxis jiangsuensis]